MPNIKKITLDHSTTGETVYSIIRREADSFLLNDADGTYAAVPADPYVSLTEDGVIKGRFEKSESRAVWNDGAYTVAIYLQSGGSPSPVADRIIGTGEMHIVSDTEVVPQSATQIAAANAARTVDGAITVAKAERITLAALAGARAGLGTATEQYMAQDGTTPRITLTPDINGNGTPTLDGA